MHAEYIGDGPFSLWSNPANWADGKVPDSSQGLHIQFSSHARGSDDLGTAQSLFVANDIIGANLNLRVIGFLSVNDISGSAILVGGHLQLGHDARLGSVGFIGDGTCEIEHDTGNTSFIFRSATPDTLQARNATLILDHPPHGSLDDIINFQGGFFGPNSGGTGKVELKGVSFDHVNAVPNPSGDFTLQLTEEGALVYQMTHVSLEPGGNLGLSVGVDSNTGHNYVAFS